MLFRHRRSGSILKEDGRKPSRQNQVAQNGGMNHQDMISCPSNIFVWSTFVTSSSHRLKSCWALVSPSFIPFYTLEKCWWWGGVLWGQATAKQQQHITSKPQECLFEHAIYVSGCIMFLEHGFIMPIILPSPDFLCFVFLVGWDRFIGVVSPFASQRSVSLSLSLYVFFFSVYFLSALSV